MEEEKEGMDFWELIGAAYQAAAEGEAARTGKASPKWEAADEYADSLRKQGVSEEQIAHMLRLGGYPSER